MSDTLYWNAEPPRDDGEEEPPKPAPKKSSAGNQPTMYDAEVTTAPTKQPVRLKPQARLPGTPYEIVQWLGDGGMGAVFEAVHTDLDRRVALKILNTLRRGPVVDLFRQEARALAKLGSPYVVHVHDFIELPDGRLVIAMELIEGQMLSEALSGPMPVERAIPILRQVCKGLSVAHRKDIVHRDIKPANIGLVRREGREDAVKLLDFGIAKVAGSSARSESPVANSGFAGTPGYIAPEVASGVGGDGRSDLYGLGCVAYLMLAGRAPFLEKEPAALMAAHLADEPPPPSDFAEVPAVLEDIILKCLAKKPSERYASAEDLEAALCEAQLALKLQTPWDDLPLPDIDPEARDRLLRRWPEFASRSKRSLLPWAFAGLATVGAVGWVVNDRINPPPELAQREVESLAQDARAAAARAFFVYPPPENPELPTAYSFIRRLEELETDEATQRARSLRTEFADTLERLGDRYWDEEAGRPFALDYYAEALVFDGTRAALLQRAAMTPGELRLLTQKAGSMDFSEPELVAVEALVVLADIDETQKEERLEKMEKNETERAASTEARLDKLVPRKRKRRKPKPRPADDAETPSVVFPPGTDTSEGIVVDAGIISSESEAAPAEEPKDKAPDRDAAKLATKQGDAARTKGDSFAAERAYVRALEADRKYARAYAGLARLHFDGSNYALSARDAKRAVRYAPKNSEYRILLGDALYKSFENTKARNQYQRAAELGHPEAQQRLAKLAKLGG